MELFLKQFNSNEKLLNSYECSFTKNEELIHGNLFITKSSVYFASDSSIDESKVKRENKISKKKLFFCLFFL